MAFSFADVLSALPSTGSKGSCGLFVSGSDKSIPLRLRAVEAKVYCDTNLADTTEQLAFIADEDVSVVFKFPLPPRSAVYRLEAVIGDRRIVTEVKEKKEAQAEFDSAVQQGHTAVIAKQEETSQIFTLELGNLEAMQEAVISLSYLRLLDSVGGALEYVHTATWTPPYTGSVGDATRGAATTLEQNPRFAGKVGYTLAYDLSLLCSRAIRAVESPGVDFRCEDLPEGAGKRVLVSEEVADPSKDLTVLIDLAPLAEAHHTAACTDGTGNLTIQRTPPPSHEPTAKESLVALATFVPHELPGHSSDQAGKEGVTTTQTFTPLHTEVVLVVDCSGSMMGSRTEQAREAALYLVKDLPPNRGIKFNVVCFGSHHESWEAAPRELTAATMASAVKWVQRHVNADMGGTEILDAFKAVYATPITPGYTRSIIFLTDGGISGGEEQAVFELVSAGCAAAAAAAAPTALQSGIQRLKDKVLRKGVDAPAQDSTSGNNNTTAQQVPAVLCLGIGHGVHRGLLDGVAKRSGGVAQYVIDGESIVKKTLFLRKAALAGASAVLSPRVLCGGALVEVAPHVLPPRLFPGEPLHVLVALQKVPDMDAASVELRGTRGDGSPFSIKMPLKGVSVTQGATYHVLHALCKVSSLLDGRSSLHCQPDGTPVEPHPSEDSVKAAVVAAALPANLVTCHTAAVGVMLQVDPLDTRQVKKVEVPLAVPHGADLFKNSKEQTQDEILAQIGAMTSSMGVMARGMNVHRAGCTLSAADVTMFCKKAPAKSKGFGGFVGKLFGGMGTGSAAPRRSAMPLIGSASGCALPPPPAPCAAPMMTFAPSAAAGTEAGSGVADKLTFGRQLLDQCEVLGARIVDDDEEGTQGEMAKAMDATSYMDSEAEEEGLVQAGYASPGAADGILQMEQESSKEQAATPPAAATPSEVLTRLNLLRNVDGFWEESAALLADLTSQVGGDRATAVSAARAAQPAGLSAAQWVTVLALAFLRKHCAGDKGVWEGMEAKALAWLTQGWPTANIRPLGFTILAATKLV